MRLIFPICFLILFPFTSHADLRQPDCDALKSWAATLVPNETYPLYPDIKISTLLRDETLISLFGSSITTWTRRDIGLIQGWLSTCRSQAIAAKDPETGDSFYRTMKAIKSSSRPLRTMWNAKQQADQKINMLTQQRPSSELAQILTMAEKALQGEDVSARITDLPPRYQGLARQASDITKLSRYLSAEEISISTDKLRQKRGASLADTAEKKDRQSALIREIAAVPVSQAGLTQLNRIAYKTDTGKMTRDEVDAYNQALQKKRRLIQQQLAGQQAREKQINASSPAPVLKSLETELKGTSPANVSLRGLEPGIALSKAALLAKSHWSYVEAISTKLDTKHFTPKPRDQNRFIKEERRDGGLLRFRTMSGIVGELAFIEHYTGPMDLKALYDILVKRFGKPAIYNTKADTMTLQWHKRNRYLMITAGARIAGSARNYSSSVAVTIWSQAFKDYLASAEKKCSKLKNTPMNKLSIKDRQAVMMDCLTP